MKTSPKPWDKLKRVFDGIKLDNINAVATFSYLDGQKAEQNRIKEYIRKCAWIHPKLRETICKEISKIKDKS